MEQYVVAKHTPETLRLLNNNEDNKNYKEKEEIKLLTINEDDKKDKEDMLQSKISTINREIAKLKEIFAKNPLDSLKPAEADVLFRTREHYYTYP